MSTTDPRQKDSTLPSSYVRLTWTYQNWCTITVCSSCGMRGHYADCHRVDPCWRCGDKVKEQVGRWVTTRRAHWLYPLLSSDGGDGYWQLKGEPSHTDNQDTP